MPITVVLPANADTRLSEQVYQTLLESILRGDLKPGQVVSELSLARAIGVSRTPVHDAMVQLLKDGLIRQQRHQRAVIAQFTAEDVREIFEMRALLEGESAWRAATRIDRPTLAELHAQAVRIEEQWGLDGWLERWADFDESFHTTIASAGGNRRLTAEVQKYRKLHRGLNRTLKAATVLRQALEEHLRILTALDRRDAEAARSAMVGHIREWQAYFVNHSMIRPGDAAD